MDAETGETAEHEHAPEAKSESERDCAKEHEPLFGVLTQLFH